MYRQASVTGSLLASPLQFVRPTEADTCALILPGLMGTVLWAVFRVYLVPTLMAAAYAYLATTLMVVAHPHSVARRIWEQHARPQRTRVE